MPLEDTVTTDKLAPMAKALLGKVLNWPLTEQERVYFVTKLMEIYAFNEAADLELGSPLLQMNFQD